MEAESETKAVHVMITGRVQGVGYRAWVRRTAGALGISGWVRNLPTGEVEALFSGAETSVEAMLEACGEGPTFARVEDVRNLGAAEPVSGALTILTDR